MNKKSSVSLGPGAPSQILIFVALSMSVLGMLSLMSARNDLALSERSVQVVETVYALNERAEESRRELDCMLAQCASEATDADYLNRVAESLPEGVELVDDQLYWTETEGERTLECALTIQPLDGSEYSVWSCHRLITDLSEEDAWN